MGLQNSYRMEHINNFSSNVSTFANVTDVCHWTTRIEKTESMKAQVSIILKLCVCLISFQLYAQDNNALSVAIEQFKIDANEKRQIELKLVALNKKPPLFHNVLRA